MGLVLLEFALGEDLQEWCLDILQQQSQIDPLLLDFISQCLVLNPAARPTFFELLSHPYLSNTQVNTARWTKAPLFYHSIESCELEYYLWGLSGDIVFEYSKNAATPSILLIPVDKCSIEPRTSLLPDTDVYSSIYIDTSDILKKESWVPKDGFAQPFKNSRFSFSCIQNSPFTTRNSLNMQSISKNAGYQILRIREFDQLLQRYPHTIEEIKMAAINDIPLVRFV